MDGEYFKSQCAQSLNHSFGTTVSCAEINVNNSYSLSSCIRPANRCRFQMENRMFKRAIPTDPDGHCQRHITWRRNDNLQQFDPFINVNSAALAASNLADFESVRHKVPAKNRRGGNCS